MRYNVTDQNPVRMNEEDIVYVKKCVCLGVSESNAGGSVEDIRDIINKAWGAFTN